MTVTVVNHMAKGVEVHACGCSDIARQKKMRRLNSDWTVEVPEGVSVIDAVVADLNESFGWEAGSDEPAPWAAHDVRVLPCVKKAK
jgi:hypothetical protein